MSKSWCRNIISLLIAFSLAVCLFQADFDGLTINGTDSHLRNVITSITGSVSFDISTKSEESSSANELICANCSSSYRSIFRYDRSIVLFIFIFAVLLFLYVRYTAFSYQTVNCSQFFIINFIHNLDGMKP